MDLTEISGFFSYSHDDEQDDYLYNLCNDLRIEYKRITGSELKLFFDRKSIEWGDRWEENIIAGIELSSFFIPVISPNYFGSSYCKTELDQFLNKVEQGDAKELVMPILLVNIQASYLNIDQNDVHRILKYQYEDWTDLRFESRNNAQYKRKINKMALRLVDVNQDLLRRAEVVMQDIDVVKPTERGLKEKADIVQAKSDDSSEENGYYFESLIFIDENMSKLTDYLNHLVEYMGEVGDIANDGTQEINEAAEKQQGLKAILPITKRMSDRLLPVAKNYEEYATKCSSLIIDMDPHMQIVISTWNPSDDADVNDRKQEIINLSSSAAIARSQLTSFVQSISSIKQLSRFLNEPFKIIERATVSCVSSFSLVEKWGEKISE